MVGPLFDSGRLQAEIDGSVAERAAAFELYRQAVFRALGDAEAAYGLVAATDAELSSAADELRLRERSRKVADAQYRSGLVDVTVLLDASRREEASGLRLIEVTGRARRARTILWQSLGGDR